MPPRDIDPVVLVMELDDDEVEMESASVMVGRPAVHVVAARRTESMAGSRLFWGDAAGVEKIFDDGLWETDLWTAGPGDGVRALARFSEMRADLRGEKGSQESL